MNANLENRLRKLEATTGDRDARMFVVGTSTPAEGQALANELRRSGQISENDSIVFTGVKRSPGLVTDYGPIDAMLEHIAAEGGKIFPDVD